MGIAPLGDCATLIKDTVSPSDLGGLPYVGLEHIGENTLSLIGHGSADDVISPKARFRKGDILFGKLRPYFRKVIRAPFDGICSTDIWVIRAKNGIEPEYLFYCMASQSLVDFASSASEGTRMPRAKWDYVSTYKLPIPPLSERQSIARTLGALDDKIELNRRMNETLEEMARALFKSWFVDFDPVRAKMEGRDPYLPSGLWNLFPDALDDEGTPVGWARTPLYEIADFRNGLALQKFPASDPDVSLPIIKIAELRGGITPKSGRASRDIPRECVVSDGDFLFSWSGSLLAKFWTGGDGALNQHLFKVTSDRVPSWFFSQWIHHHLEGFRAIAASKATTMGHIQRRHLEEAITICPPSEILSLLGQSVGPLVEHTIKNELQNGALTEIRDLLLPKLMSGKIRLRDAEEMMEAAA